MPKSELQVEKCAIVDKRVILSFLNIKIHAYGVGASNIVDAISALQKTMRQDVCSTGGFTSAINPSKITIK